MLFTNKKWIGIFVGSAVLVVAFLISGESLDGLLFVKDNMYGGFCFDFAAMLPMVLCSFSFGTLMHNRNTKTSRTKNKLLNCLFAVLCVIMAALAGYYPFRNVLQKPYIVMAIITIVISAASLYINYVAFKETRQKIIMTKVAKVTLLATGIIVAVCAIALLLPQKYSYYAINEAMNLYGSTDNMTGMAKAPIFCFAGAAASMMIWLNYLVKVIPKLKFSSILVFTTSLVWIAVMFFGILTSGNSYASEIMYGILLGFGSMFVADKIVFRKKAE